VASPRPKFAAAVGVFIGLLLGALAAIGTGVTDRRRLAALEAVPVAATSRPGALWDNEERERVEHPFPAQPQSTRAVRDNAERERLERPFPAQPQSTRAVRD
jgi:hypothetical protein